MNNSISNKMQQAADLYSKLEKSKRMQSVWSNCFVDGFECSPMAIYAMKPYPSTDKYIKRAYLRRQDGVCYDITPEQFLYITGQVSKEAVDKLFKKIIG